MNPAQMSHAEISAFNAQMADKIRQTPVQPYTEGRHVLRILHILGRATGQDRQTPLAVTQFDGHRYVCAPNRSRDWVRNLLAAGSCHIEGDPVPEHAATLIESDDAAVILAIYLGNVAQPSSFWPFPPGAPIEEIRRHTGSTAVFRLTPVTG
ncbi:hypothetical protein GCM10012275_59920 [Longimycelium tulufanense]|uniref:Nitroreductase family deazaflavin-dependent oxidoreductase n=1 Tax=Longimycelium tulufanense TaxID=907463 RepID=A0A8J3CK17_9PSEU|nr:hypothetical protein GCM10012275_59920 [Longimycelium tulufanense]